MAARNEHIYKKINMSTKAEENYLKAIFKLFEKEHKSVSTNAISEELETKPSSVSDMLKKLSEKDLINYIKYQGVSLTPLGYSLAVNVIRKHRLWEVFLVNHLNFKWDQVHDIAEQLEHIKSIELVNRLDSFLNFPSYDPHGDPIPNKEGNIEKMNQKVLIELHELQKGIITGVKKGTASLLSYLDKEKIKLGDKIQVLEIIEFDGTFIVDINGRKYTFSEKICQNLLFETYD